jgi:hypothetical protein
MRLFRRLAAIGASLALLILCGLSVYSYWLRKTADRVVRFSYELSQQGHRPKVGDVRQRFGSLLTQPDPCVAAGCGYEIMLSNIVLARLHLASYAALRSYFWAEGDMLETNELIFWSMGSKRHMVVTSVDTKYCKGCERFTVIPCGDADEGIASGSVEAEYLSTDARNGSAFGLDTACLTRLRGCDSVADLLPTVWQAQRAGAVRCLQKSTPKDEDVHGCR